MSLAGYFESVAAAQRSNALARYADLVLVAGVVAIVALMVVPLPALLIDLLVAVNIAFGVVLLLVAIYITSPLEFSVFPSVLLISTLFRLALSIATTRMILLNGDAGHIIDTFGRMVAGGNLVVGLVVFLIITVVQFIVIAKGAERVAEVAARFSLDAMPGKQLSIDSDLRSGLIDKDEARRRRRELELESKLHGSLDGAMKFVKGDAIAGIVIIVINLLGGLAIGVLQQDMSLGSAMTKYSILTIGEGMVAQIPALLGAMSAGLIVTRATDEERDRHLGDAIGRQLTAQPRVLLVGGGLCLLCAVVPGFPALVFVGLALAFLAVGSWLTPSLRQQGQRWMRPAWQSVTKRPERLPAVLSTTLPIVRPTVPLLLELPAQSATASDAAILLNRLEHLLDHFQLSLGLSLPRIDIHPLEHAPAGVSSRAAWRLLAHEVPIAQGDLPAGALHEALPEAVRQALRRHAVLFLGTQEANLLLTRAAADAPDVVKEVLRALPLARVAEILRRLVEEEVPIRNLRDILEALADAAQREKDVHTLVEMARIALKRQISYRHAPQGRLKAVLLQPELEDMLRGAIRIHAGVHQLALDPAQVAPLIDRMTTVVRTHQPAALVVAVDIRRHVRKLIEQDCFDTPVLSYHELVPSLQLDVLYRISAEAAEAPRLEEVVVPQ
jgi:type III secretion protein V